MILSVLALLGCWLALSRGVDLPRLLAGGLAAAIVVLVQRRLFPSFASLPSLLLRRPHWLLAFLVVFVYRFVSSTLSTCRLILFGGEEGRIVALPTEIEHPIGQFILLNAITLTPSTISLLIEGDLLYIHWLKAKGSRGDWKAIKESLESRLYPFFSRRRDARR